MHYYLVPMQIVALYTGVNVSMVMCPVKGDPFQVCTAHLCCLIQLKSRKVDENASL